ncbi:alpha-N-methyltransferase NTM1 [Peziza echinospora]|nr:alpha-N-methyltransferase NTM1 [Peziza echinospora]
MDEAQETFAQPASPPPPVDSRIDPTKAIEYWEQIPTSLAGIMGGYPQISRIDIISSTAFLTKLGFTAPPNPSQPAARGADCGAGIGRITKDLLTKFCTTTDVIEPVVKFTDEVSTSAPFASLREAGKIGKIINKGLEDWDPTATAAEWAIDGKPVGYDIIWNQWCVGHLRDADLVQYLRRCAKALNPTRGVIIVKENIATGTDIFDDQDSSVTRTEEKFKQLFEEAELVIVKQELQRGFPPKLGLFAVKCFALKPAPRKEV